MPFHKISVVLDKSFAQAANAEQLNGLFDRYKVLVTDSFLYETIDKIENAKGEDIKRNIGSIPSRLSYFIRVDTSRMIKYELEHKVPAPLDTARKIKFNPAFWASYKGLSDSDKQLMETFNMQRVRPAIARWKKMVASEIPGFSNQEIRTIVLENCKKLREEQIIELSQRVLEKDFVLRIAKREDMLISNAFDEKYFFYRWLQVELLHGFWLMCISQNGKMQRSDTNLEHDVHDLDYLALGLHVGAFATAESTTDFRKLGWRFKFLFPEGNLIAK